MKDEARKYLFDISEAITHIDLHLGGTRDFVLFSRNLTIQRAVERELEIIGEAMSRLLKLPNPVTVSHARQIVNLRNRVIHAYDAVDLVTIWGVINKSLPLLADEVQALLNLPD
ncbi:HepT-like ribonuclease domain-containing protein [Spirosoma spitsbergense]|uniref:HepT-like ribonuclease domain-containing protein n=1 Tax=Spirosoma spitsbergense TaxID=431554 RepID=UPI00037A10F0|nr:HepT-like ribonuclease domain-containing protein [Spirosoma spitsbergense]